MNAAIKILFSVGLSHTVKKLKEKLTTVIYSFINLQFNTGCERSQEPLPFLLAQMSMKTSLI